MNFWLHRSNEWRRHTSEALQYEVVEAVLFHLEHANLDDLESTTAGDGSDTEDSLSEVIQSHGIMFVLTTRTT